MGSRKDRNVTRVHLAEAAGRATQLPRAETSKLVGLFIDLIAESLVRGEPVMLSGFGKFTVVSRAARKARNVRMGHDVMIGPRRAIVFKPAAAIVADLTAKNSAPVQVAKEREVVGA